MGPELRGLKRAGYDLFIWRDANKGQLSRGKTAVLDTGDGAGWDLARQLLRPRSYDEVRCGNGLARVQGTVWQSAGTAWFRAGTVWHGAETVWHSVGTVLYSAGPAWHDDVQTNALAAPSTA